MTKYVIGQADRAISCTYILACWMQYMPDIYPCIHGNMPDIYFLAYTVICLTYIVAWRRQYAGGKNICVRLLPLLLQLHIPPPTICPIWHIIALLQYAREYIVQRDYWHSLNNFFCPNVCPIMQFTLIAQWTFVHLWNNFKSILEADVNLFFEVQKSSSTQRKEKKVV